MQKERRKSASSAGATVRDPRPSAPPMGSSAVRRIIETIEQCEGDPDFMTSFARGLAVLRAFTGHTRVLSVSQISLQIGIPRAAVRRALYTMLRLGYVSETDGGYCLQPRVLGIGNAYLSSATLAQMAQPVLDALRDRVQESCSLGVLDEDEALYVARAQTVRIISVGLHPGSRIPAYCSSLGRMLLAHLPEAELETYLARVAMRPRTDRTVVERARLRTLLEKARRSGYCIVDQELELGLRSVAVPVRSAKGEVVAAINIGTSSAQATLRKLETELLPQLRVAAMQLESLLQ
jgi:IclR family pca regulon transcriptional regulator